MAHLHTIRATSLKGRFEFFTVAAHILLSGCDTSITAGRGFVVFPGRTMGDFCRAAWFAIRHAFTGETQIATDENFVLIHSGSIVSKRYISL